MLRRNLRNTFRGIERIWCGHNVYSANECAESRYCYVDGDFAGGRNKDGDGNYYCDGACWGERGTEHLGGTDGTTAEFHGDGDQ